jgi:coatomer subunit beta'
MGHSETYPQSIKHSPNGRLCSVLGDGEFTIYVVGSTWRNKAFGDASEFVWGRGKVY